MVLRLREFPWGPAGPASSTSPNSAPAPFPGLSHTNTHAYAAVSTTRATTRGNEYSTSSGLS